MKRVLITGGATGIGLATSALFLERGACVAVSYLEEQQHAEAEARLPGVAWVRVDLRCPDEIERMCGTVGPVDVLVNCASMTGMPAIAPFLSCTKQQLDDIVDTNLKGTFLVSQAFARLMVKDKIAGSIVHVASVGASAGQEHAAAYCASKAGQVALSKVMAIELAPFGIRVNCVSPGDTNTTASGNIAADLKAAGATGKFLRHTPLGRRGKPEEIAAAIVWISSEEASFITGTDLLVDGGFLAY